MKTILAEAKRILRGEHKINPGSIQRSEIRALLGKDNPIILEIGSHNGGHTQWFLDLFPTCKVFCFEPDPRARRQFKEQIVDDRVQLFDVAISDTDGVTDFYMSGGLPTADWRTEMPDGWDASGSIRRPKNHLKSAPWCTFNDKIKVVTKRLDTWCKDAGIESVDFIWADVQGAEVDLINGGTKTLSRTRYFFTEYSNHELYEGQINLRTLLKLVPDFEVIQRYREDVLLRNKLIAPALRRTAA